MQNEKKDIFILCDAWLDPENVLIVPTNISKNITINVYNAYGFFTYVPGYNDLEKETSFQEYVEGYKEKKNFFNKTTNPIGEEMNKTKVYKSGDIMPQSNIYFGNDFRSFIIDINEKNMSDEKKLFYEGRLNIFPHTNVGNEYYTLKKKFFYHLLMI